MKIYDSMYIVYYRRRIILKHTKKILIFIVALTLLITACSASEGISTINTPSTYKNKALKEKSESFDKEMALAEEIEKQVEDDLNKELEKAKEEKLTESFEYYKASRPNYTQIKTRDLVFDITKSSDQVRLLKDFFRARNEADIPEGYIYDKRTRDLVKEYQELKGLEADGFPGELTMAEINKDIREMNLDISPRLPYIDSTDTMLIINKSSNTIYLLEDGVVQESYPVATGKTAALTPDGQFKIVVKFENPHWGGAGEHDPIAGGEPNNPLGKRWLGISLRGGGVYGIHGNAAPRSIGSYASLGCVRMFNEDVETLYEKVKINTPIWIGDETLLESYGVIFK